MSQPLPGWPPTSPPGWSPPRAAYAPPPGGPVPPKPSRLPLLILIGLLSAIVVVAGLGGVLLLRRDTPAAEHPPSTAPRPEPTRTPTTPADREDLLSRNPINTQAMPRVPCQQPLRPLPTDESGYDAYIGGLVTCAQNSYAGPVHAIGYALPRPTVRVYRDTVSTPCGDADPTYRVFYCQVNQTIYTTTTAFSSGVGQFRLGPYYIVLHEYAHHAQNSVGVLGAAGLDNTEADQPQLHRRIELQGDCWAFIEIATFTTFTDADWKELWSWRQNAGDIWHGQPDSQAYWIKRGLGSDRFSACNTWIGQDHVS